MQHNENDLDAFPNREDATLHVYSAVTTLHDTNNQTSSDLTGRFPFRSSLGNQYFLIFYAHDPNLIWGIPIKNRTSNQIKKGHERILDDLSKAGFKPSMHRMDNEASQELKDAFTQANIKYQLVPAHQHRTNTAERAIRTWKNHFIAGLCSVDPHFPSHLYDRLTLQANITLNLLRGSRLNPKLSAFTQVFGPYDFNRAPMPPPRTMVIAHEKPTQRATWSPHGVQGWYLGPCLDHYRCYNIFIKTTQAERICDTVQFFPKRCDVPTSNSTEDALLAAQQLTHALSNPAPAGPFNTLPKHIKPLQQLNDIFKSIIKPSDNDTHQLQGVEVEQKQPPTKQGMSTLKQNRLPTTNFPYGTLTSPNIQHKYPTRFSTQHKHNQQGTACNLSQPQSNAVLNDNGKKLEYRQLINNPETARTWNTSSANEFGRLAQGVGNRVEGTNTLRFIRKKDIPKGKRATYARYVCDIRPHKEEVHRVRITVGGNLIEYPFSVTTKTTDMTILFNSVLSTPGARFLTIDIKNFYLNTEMDIYEYMWFKCEDIPQEIIREYNLHLFVEDDGYVYSEIQKGMYGLPQAGKLAANKLTKIIKPHG